MTPITNEDALQNSDPNHQEIGEMRQKSPPQSDMDRVIGLFQSGDLLKVCAELESMCHEFPDHAFAWKGLSVSRHVLGQKELALDAMTHVIRIDPGDPEAQSNLGALLQELGQSQAALVHLEEAVRLKPDYADAYFNLGNARRNLAMLQEAAHAYRVAISLKPDFGMAYCNIGLCFKDLLRPIDAEQALRKAIKVDPDDPSLYFNLGNLLESLGHSHEALRMLGEAVNRKADFSEAYTNRGVIQRSIGLLGAAESSFREAIRIAPENAELKSNLAVLLGELGESQAAEDLMREAIKHDPQQLIFRSNLLFLMSTISGGDRDRYLKEARAFGALVSDLAAKKTVHWSVEPSPCPLKIGLVGGDFRNHPVGFFIEGLARSLDSTRIELFAFPTNLLHDDLTARLVTLFKGWHPIFGMPDQAASQLIHSLGIHILIDLSGHTDHNRLGVFGYKPAPIQASWLGYWASTGVVEMDYLIGDVHVTPLSDDACFTERLYRLPETRYCYTAPDCEVEVNTLPALTNGFITFGSFNKLHKMTEEVVSVWSEILRKVPESRLLLKAGPLCDPAMRETVSQRFQDQGIESNRLCLESASSRSQYFAAYRRVDMGLDPFPFPGGNTTVDSLWMGVPVLTLEGKTLLSRQGEGITLSSGQVDWVASDKDDYVLKALRFASDLEALAEIRKNLRERVLKSPLFDTQRFATNFESAMFDLWKIRSGH